LNTLYVDKNLKHHGLIQAFSRTNRVLNDTKPYGNILDFRQQQEAVDTAIKLFSGQDGAKSAKEIWLVDKAPVVIDKLQTAVHKLGDFMQSQGLDNKPEEVPNLKGDAARSQFVNLFKEVQRLKTQIDQYTDLSEENKETVEQIVPKDQLQGFKGVYLETAQRLKEKQDKGGDSIPEEVEQLDFEFVLFASAVIDYDYIMALIARYSQQEPGKQKMSREELIGLIRSDAKFMDEGDDIADYIDTLEAGKGLDEKAIRDGFQRFKADKHARRVAVIADTHGLERVALQGFVDNIMRRMIFDGELLSDLMAPLDLGWKARTKAELALMDDLILLLHKLAQGREISGLGVYE
ncbi:MAG: type I restriction endonuclease subunit R, partial [Candidatus Electrothrix sp. AR5]|nr:type I restriction endonuclease subunit R [Candidatus Electrothrix sp. AR5]